MKYFLALLNRISLAILLFSAPLFSSGTDTIFFSLPNVSAFRGDTVRIPLNVLGIQLSDSIYSGDIVLSYDTTVVQILSVQSDSIMPAGASLSFNPALKKIGFASSTRLTGSGVLLKLVFRLRPSAVSFSQINVVSVLLNEGGFNIKITNGAINPINRLPKFINVLNDTSVIEKDSIVISFAAIDPDGDPLKYFLENSLIKSISGVFFDSLTGTFAWRPQLNHQGVYVVPVKVIDNRGGFSTAQINLTVKNLNQNPQIVALPDTIFHQENILLKDTVTAIDQDVDPLFFSLQNFPVGMTIKPAGSNLNVYRAEISWTPGFNQAGTYPVTIVVKDTAGGIATKVIVYRIADVNRSPVYTFPPRDTTIDENTFVTMSVKAIDPDNDPIIYGLSGAPPGMTIDPFGTISWTPNFSQAGKYTFDVGAGDTKGLPTIASVTFSVVNVNRPPQFISVLPDTTIKANASFTFQYSAVDPDLSDTLSFGLFSGPPGASVSPKGLLNWPPTSLQLGPTMIVVGVTDGKGGSLDTAVITVQNSNTVPQFTFTLRDTVIKVNNLFSFQYAASDIDITDTLSYNLVKGPQGVIVSPKGLVSWTPNDSQIGQHQIVVGVSDGKSSAVDTAIVMVQNINRPPQFVITLPDVKTFVDSVVSFKYSAVDPDNDILSFSFAKFPSGATIQTDGTFSWKPSAIHLGKDTIIVAVNDGTVSIPDTAVFSVSGFPAAEVAQTVFDFGSITFGGTKTLKAIIKNNGVVPLFFQVTPQSNAAPDPNFIIDTAGVSIVLPGQQNSVSIIYSPKSVGGHFTAWMITTNDPKNSSFGLNANGSAIAKLVVTKRVLVDTLHNSPMSFTDSTKGIGLLFKFFGQSGIQISLTGSVLRPSGNDILLLIAPQKSFTKQEIDSVKKFVTNGGLLIALGNSANEGNNPSALNSLLNDTSWTTNLSLDSNLVVDSSSFFGDASVPLLTTFADAKHPYFANVDTLVFFGSASVTVSGTAVPLISTIKQGKTIGSKNIAQPAVAGLSKVGKGKILLLGDADVWNVESSDQKSPPNISVKDNLAFAINVFSVTEDYEVKMPAKTPNEKYQMVSIPFDLENSDVSFVLKGLGGLNPLVWRLFGRYDPATSKYAEFPTEKFKSFKRGEGYWLITRGEFGLSLGNSTIVPVQSFYPIKIGPGYSMVGNPFPYKVSWKNSLHDSTQTIIWKFDGETFKAESLAMDPFAGYFVKNLSKDSITIYINPEDITNLKKSGYSAAVYQEGEWRIGIGAVSGKSADQENFAGVAQNAKNEFDINDVAEPPSSPTDYVIVRFQNNSWKQQSGSYAVDIRAINNEGLFWDFDVITAKPQSKVTIDITQFGNIPNSFVIYIVDKSTERVMQLEKTYQYEFTMAKNEVRRNFRLIAGKKEYIEKNTQGIPIIAVTYSLMQNYPNPFNPSTQIRYTLGHSGHVSLNVYNVLGQHVRSLTNTIQSIGTYELEWDGKDNTGSTVSTGVYFYTITVTSNGEKIFKETKKLMLLK